MTSIERRFVTLHGYRVAYRTGGATEDVERPVLVLVHGIADSSETWRKVLPGLARNHRVVALDLLGYGDSGKPRHDYSLGGFANVIRDLMVALEIESATLLGHSLGGGVAMQFAYQHPTRCERLVLVSTGGLGPEVSWILRALAAPGAEYVIPLLFPRVMRYAGKALGAGLRRLGVRAPVLADEWRAYAALTEPANRDPFVRTLRSVIDVRGQAITARDRLYLTSHLPTLIVWGARDRIIPVAHATAAHQALPGSRLVIFERSGHFPHTEDPDRFVDAVTDFVASTEPMRIDEPQWQARLAAGPPS